MSEESIVNNSDVLGISDFPFNNYLNGEWIASTDDELAHMDLTDFMRVVCNVFMASISEYDIKEILLPLWVEALVDTLPS